MSAPRSVRTEAASMTSTVTYWSYAGSDGLSLYRSTDGVDYSVVTAAILSTDTSYTDTDLDPGIKYWYKLSDDVGATFSSVVTVYTHFCVDQMLNRTFSLPRFDGDAQQAADLNAMAERIEKALGQIEMNPGQCVACVEDGAVVIDCSDGCRDWYVIADEDVNSISIQRCGNTGPAVTFVVPSSTTVGICGFPAGWGFTGDECTEAPISGGTAGRFVNIFGVGGVGGGSGSPPLGKSSSSGAPGTGGGGGKGGAACDCVPGKQGELTIKCCTDNCSLSCQGNKTLQVKVCGGVGPYTWSKTGSGFKYKGTGDESTDTTTATGKSVTIRPIVNTGSAVAGSAYAKCIIAAGCGHTIGSTHADGATAASYGCNDVLIACPVIVACAATVFCLLEAGCACGTHDGHPLTGGGVVDCGCTGSAGQECSKAQTRGTMSDLRTAQMITDGCTPCGLNDGGIVTVTDATGVSVSVTVKS